MKNHDHLSLIKINLFSGNKWFFIQREKIWRNNSLWENRHRCSAGRIARQKCDKHYVPDMWFKDVPKWCAPVLVKPWYTWRSAIPILERKCSFSGPGSNHLKICSVTDLWFWNDSRILWWNYFSNLECSAFFP